MLANLISLLGIVVLLLLAWLGTWWAGGYFFENFIETPEQAQFSLLSGGIMPLANIGLGLKVASALFLVFTILTALRIAESAADSEADQEEEKP